MKRMGVVLVFLCVIAPAYGVQEVTLKDLPPLQPLHWCKHSDGHVAAQNEPCGSDTTEVSSTATKSPDGTLNFHPLEKQQATDTTDNSTASESASKEDQHPDLKKSELGRLLETDGQMACMLPLLGRTGSETSKAILSCCGSFWGLFYGRSWWR